MRENFFDFVEARVVGCGPVAVRVGLIVEGYRAAQRLLRRVAVPRADHDVLIDQCHLAGGQLHDTAVLNAALDGEDDAAAPRYPRSNVACRRDARNIIPVRRFCAIPERVLLGLLIGWSLIKRIAVGGAGRSMFTGVSFTTRILIKF